MVPVRSVANDERYNQTESFSKLSREWYLATALYDAIDDGDIRQVTILLNEKHACPNVVVPEYGISPLHLAVGHHCETFAKEAIKLILRNGGNPNIKADDSLSPIHIASAWNRPEIVRLLLSYGADPWQLDDKEKNAFHYAYEQNAWESTKALDAFRKIDNCDPVNRNLTACEYNLDKVIVYGKNVQAEYKVMTTSSKALCSKHSVSTQTERCSISFSGEQHLYRKQPSPDIEQSKFDAVYLSRCMTDILKVDDEFDLIKNAENDTLSDSSKTKIISHRKGSLYEFCPSFVDRFSESDEAKNTSKLTSDLLVRVNGRRRISNDKQDPVQECAVNDPVSDVGRYTATLLISEEDDRRRDTYNYENNFSATSLLLSEEDRYDKNKIDNDNLIGASNEEEVEVVHAIDHSTEHPVAGDDDDCSELEIMSQISRREKRSLNDRDRLNDSPTKVPRDIDRNKSKEFPRLSEEGNVYVNESDLLTEEEFEINRNNKDDNNYFSCPGEGGSDGNYKSAVETDVERPPSIRNDDDKDESDDELLFSEQFKYTDDEEGVILIENRLPGKSICDGLRGETRQTDFKEDCAQNSNKNGQSATLDHGTDENNHLLKKIFKCRGFSSGRVETGEMKRLYLQKLNIIRNTSAVVNFPLKSSQFNVQLQSLLEQEDNNWLRTLSEWCSLESEMIDYFSKHSNGKKWPGGCISASFTYLLLDPTVTCNLPLRCDRIGLNETWRAFLESIFYIGKGKNQRPYSHLYEASNAWNRSGVVTTTTGMCNMKVKHILEIWNLGLGVVCLHVFQNLTSAEASTREAAMIDAVGLPRLKNERKGVYYGNVVNWSRSQKQRLGIYLLYRAMMVLLADGERQLKPNEIDC